jgi:WD40 repeat protein
MLRTLSYRPLLPRTYLCLVTNYFAALRCVCVWVCVRGRGIHRAASLEFMDDEEAGASHPSKAAASTGDDSREADAYHPTTPSVQGFAKEALILLNQERYLEHQASVLLCEASPQGSVVATVDANNCLKIWAVSPAPTTKASLVLASKPSCVSWDQDGDCDVLFLGFEGKLSQLNIATLSFTDFEPTGDFTKVIALATMSHMLACSFGEIVPADEGAKKGSLCLLDTKKFGAEAPLPIRSHSARVNCFHFNHNGTLLVAGFVDGMVRIVDTRTQTFIMGWQAHRMELRAVRFSNDETTVFTSSNDKTLMRWNAHHLGQPVIQSSLQLLETERDVRDGADGAGQVPMVESSGNVDVLDFALDSENEFVLRVEAPVAGECATDAQIFQLRHKTDDTHAPPVLRLTGHAEQVLCIGWCASTNTCFSGSSDNTVNIYTLFKAPR